MSSIPQAVRRLGANTRHLSPCFRILTTLVLAISLAVLLTGQSRAQKVITPPASAEAPQQQAAPPPASAEAPEQSDALQPSFTNRGPIGPRIGIGLSEGTRLRLRSPPGTVFVADPNVADVQFDPPDVIYVFGKSPGQTVLYASDKAGNIILNNVIDVAGPVTIIRRAEIHPGGQPEPTTTTQSETRLSRGNATSKSTTTTTNPWRKSFGLDRLDPPRLRAALCGPSQFCRAPRTSGSTGDAAPAAST